MVQCAAHSKQTKDQCRRAAMHGRTTCYMHGGVTTTLGPANVHYKTGRYSKVLPVRLQARYEEARTNPRLLSLADDIATAESRLADLFQRVDSGESGALWQALGATLDAFHVAMTTNDPPAMQRHLATMRRLITQGTGDYAAWAEIQALWETRCKLTQTELKTLVTSQQMITTEQLMVYLGVVTDAITRCVQAHTEAPAARVILGALSAEFEHLTLLDALRKA